MRIESTASRILCRFGRLLAMVSVLIYKKLFVCKRFDEPSTAYVAIVAALGFAAAGAIVAWLRNSTGGVILLVAGVALAVRFGEAAQRDQTSAVLVQHPLPCRETGAIVGAGSTT